MLSAEYLWEIFDYQPPYLIWKVNRGTNKLKGKRAGTKTKKGYIRVRIGKELYMAHVLIWCMVTGEWPKEDIDHWNQIKDDNRFENLRVASRSQNKANVAITSRNTSGYKGVSWQDGRAKAQIQYNGQKYFIGYFLTVEEAALAYNKKALEFFGEYACLNNIQGD